MGTIALAGAGWAPPAARAAPATGLVFPGNNVAGSDIRILHQVSRFDATVMWKKRYAANAGYEAVLWFSPNTGTWDSGAHSVGFHGHPCDGTYDSTGQRLVGTGGGGTVQYEEIAGLLSAADFIASPSSPGPQSTFLLVGAAWRSQCAVIVANGSATDHTYYPDLVNRPTEFIKQSVTTASIGSGGASPRMYWGASDWTASGSANSETPSAVLRGMQVHSPALTNKTHIDALAAMETDAQVLAYCSANGITSLVYLNMNPTPSDVSDKSGNGNNPSWANDNRPTLYTA